MATSFAAPRLRRLAHHPSRTSGPGSGHEPAGGEQCDLCAEPLAEEHRHLLDLRTGEVSCGCRSCSLLFDRHEPGAAAPGTEAGRFHYRLLPQRRQRLDTCRIDDAIWAALGIPVDLAFFTRGEATGDVTAGYPSPLGTLRHTVDPQIWHELAASGPVLSSALSTMADDVEALLVNRARGAREHWLVPLDDCYRLVAVVRAHWKGLGGGPDVWQHIEEFFSGLSNGFRSTSEEASWPTSR